MVMNLVPALIEIGGSGIIAWSIFAAQILIARTSATQELLKEFNSVEMSEARARAFRHVMSAIKDGESEWEDVAQTPATELSSVEYLYLISRFYHRLEAMRSSQLLSDKRLLSLFGHSFGYWWGLTFEEQMGRGDSFRIKSDLNQLNGFFSSRSKKERRTEEWLEWVEAGKTARKSAIDRLGIEPTIKN